MFVDIDDIGFGKMLIDGILNVVDDEFGEGYNFI